MKHTFIFLLVIVAFLPIYGQRNKHIVISPDSVLMNKRFCNVITQIGALKNRPVTLDLSPATYYFSRKNAVKKLYYVSNTTSEEENPNPVKHIALDLHGLKNVTIDGHGATLVMKGLMTDFVLDSCENITFRNINFDYEHPTLTEMQIEECGGNYLIAKVHPDSQYKIENNKLYWWGEGWFFSGGIAQTYDPSEDITWRSWSPMYGLKRAVELKKNLLYLEYDTKPSVKVGSVFQMRDGLRREVCGLVKESKNIRFEHVNFYFLGNFGVTCQTAENITFDGVNFAPRPGSGRTAAGYADFLHVSGCKGFLKVSHCNFKGAHDDPINVHGTHLKVVQFENSRQVRLRFMHPQSYGFNVFFAGDQIDFVNDSTLLPVYSSTILKVKTSPDCPREVVLYLTKPLPATLVEQPNLVVENVSCTPDVFISDNYFSRVPTRGVLVTTRGKVRIENNVFFRMQMSGILIADDARSWYESGSVHDVTIRNNQFIECGAPAVNIAPESLGSQAVHHTIGITDNIFQLKKDASMAVSARLVDGLTIAHNLFLVNDSILKTPAQCVEIKNCSHVELQNNRLETETDR